MTLPSPTELGKLIASSSYSEIDKKLIMLRIKNMSKDQIIRLYEALLNLKIEESRFISTCDTLDLEYQMKFHEAFADFKDKEVDKNITSRQSI